MSEPTDTTAVDAVKDVAVGVAKDLGVAIVGTVVGTGLFVAGAKISNKLQARRFRKNQEKTTND